MISQAGGGVVGSATNERTSDAGISSVPSEKKPNPHRRQYLALPLRGDPQPAQNIEATCPLFIRFDASVGVAFAISVLGEGASCHWRQ